MPWRASIKPGWLQSSSSSSFSAANDAAAAAGAASAFGSLGSSVSWLLPWALEGAGFALAFPLPLPFLDARGGFGLLGSLPAAAAGGEK